jgi:YD repeat-containing protein
LPSRIALPGRTIDLSYDNEGRLLTRAETDTTNGQTRSWTYVYQEVGPGPANPPARLTLPMVNPGAEAGDLTGWTTETGTYIVQQTSQSYEGSFRFKTNSGTEAVIYQDVAVPLEVQADVDNERTAVELFWQQKSPGADNDPGGTVLVFLNGLGSPIGAASESELLAWPDSAWRARMHSADVPAGTRSIRVKLRAERHTGSAFDAYFDALRLDLRPRRTLPPGPMPLLASIDGPRTDVADITAFDYDQSGNLVRVTDALGHETAITAHDGAGRPLTVVDENGIETTLAYTPRRWLATVTVDSGAGGVPATTSFTYDGVGQITRVALPGGPALNYEYDAPHRLIAVSNDQGERIEYTLDAMGNRTSEAIKAAGGITKRTQARAFDELGRLLQSIGAASQTFGYGYDPNGNVTSEADGLGRTWAYAFDGLNRLVQATDPLSGEADYGYDGQDTLT